MEDELRALNECKEESRLRLENLKKKCSIVKSSLAGAKSSSIDCALLAKIELCNKQVMFSLFHKYKENIRRSFIVGSDNRNGHCYK